jgi:hypothetical protein
MISHSSAFIIGVIKYVLVVVLIVSLTVIVAGMIGASTSDLYSRIARCLSGL